MMNARRLLAAVLALVLLLALSPAAVHAEETAPLANTLNYNVVVVLDCSGSLEGEGGQKSDPDRYRYEAVSMFLDLLTETGNNVSAIVFNGNNTDHDTSDRAMRKALVLNTPLEEISSKEDKEALLKKIWDKLDTGGYTDIGTALLAAAEKLEGKTAENGLKSIIVLFTDGATQTKDSKSQGPIYQQSIANGEAATKLILENGITLCGVFLGDKDRDGAKELAKLVRDANDLDRDIPDDQLGALFCPVENASNLPDTFQGFYELISQTEAIPLKATDSFRLPTGIKDANICIITDDPEVMSGISLTLSHSGESPWNAQELSAIRSQSETYAVYKLTEPTPGQWDVEFHIPAGAENVRCSLLVNAQISAGMKTTPVADEVRYGTSVKVYGHLYEDGVKQTDPNAYTEYDEIYLELKNAADETDIQKLPLSPSNTEEEGFAYYTPHDPDRFGAYWASVVFKCGNTVSVRTEPQMWRLSNTAPDVDAYIDVDIVSGFGGNGKEEVDLSKVVIDREDKRFTDLTASFDYGSYSQDAVKYDEQTGLLTIDGGLGGAGTFTITFRDTQDAIATTEVRVHYANHIVRDSSILGLMVVLVVIAFLAAPYLYKANQQLAGSLCFSIDLIGRDNKDHLLQFCIRASECLNRDLYEILNARKRTIITLAQEKVPLRRIAEESVKTFLMDHRNALSEYSIRLCPGEKARTARCFQLVCSGDNSRTHQIGGDDQEATLKLGRRALTIAYTDGAVEMDHDL